jgi:hypothetical protein
MVRYSVLSFLLQVGRLISNKLLSMRGDRRLEYDRKHHLECTI